MDHKYVHICKDHPGDCKEDKTENLCTYNPTHISYCCKSKKDHLESQDKPKLYLVKK